MLSHVALGTVGLAILLPGKSWRGSVAVLAVAAAVLRFGLPAETIQNTQEVPLTMAQEGAGPDSPFWPSGANTNTNGLIPSDFFMESNKCGECHQDIYEQWKSSMHHFASFNNQFYRRSIEHMQELSGTEGSKWCAGCHDHAVFFNGRFDKPIKDQVETPEAQNGLGCVSCHSITHVNGTVGNASFTIRYPPLHELASSETPLVKAASEYLTYLNPEPHRQTFIRPFMRNNSEFCATCHKVHLDQPVNNYRWFRGFNEYDNWQASGVSGQGARSFYYPEQSATCNTCHMPLVASNDPGNHDGMVHSHRFAAANTAVPTVNQDQEQLDAATEFLQSGFITVDLFAATEVPPNEQGKVEMRRLDSDVPQLSSTFAVGEEAQSNGPVVIREVGQVAAPLDAPDVRFAPGATVRVDAVVRTRKIGHFFPGGTVDPFDVWLEFKALDANGSVLAWSGGVEDDGHGPVDKGAHFYRSYLLDGAGNPIDKRNAWQARSLLYVRLIPPGAADTVHFRLDIPEGCGGADHA